MAARLNGREKSHPLPNPPIKSLQKKKKKNPQQQRSASCGVARLNGREKPPTTEPTHQITKKKKKKPTAIEIGIRWHGEVEQKRENQQQ